jgi:hypothetical protein
MILDERVSCLWIDFIDLGADEDAHEMCYGGKDFVSTYARSWMMFAFI